MWGYDTFVAAARKEWLQPAVFMALLSCLVVFLCSCNGAGDGFIPTHSISGNVTAGGVGVAGVSIVLSGNSSAIVTTDANGNYSFHGLGNGSYTVTPNDPSLVISPFNSQQVIDGQDLVGVNFIAPTNPNPTFSLSGTVTANGVGLVGVAVSLSGTSSATVLTDGNGKYAFTKLTNGFYTVGVGKNGFLFAPASSAQTINGANVIAVDFVATPTVLPLFSISGTVTSPLGGVAGVTVTLDGAASATAFSDATGKFVFAGLTNGNYTLTPAKNGFSFAPTSSQLIINGANRTAADFAATAIVISTFQISGAIVANGSGVANLTILLSGGSTAMVTTDANGKYIFSGLANGDYTLTPQSSAFSFTPVRSVQTVAGADISGVDFTATANPVPTFSISGTVTAGGIPLPGTPLTLGGFGTATTNTDTKGQYTFTGLANGTYTVAPVNTGFVFAPVSRSMVVGGQDVTGVDFVGTASQLAQAVTCPASGVTEATVADFAFTPANLFVGVNDIVRWTNNGPSSHTVTSGSSPVANGNFDSGTLSSGGTVCVQFLAAGTNFYFCRIHPFMTGSVTVQ